MLPGVDESIARTGPRQNSRALSRHCNSATPSCLPEHYQKNIQHLYEKRFNRGFAHKTSQTDFAILAAATFTRQTTLPVDRMFPYSDSLQQSPLRQVWPSVNLHVLWHIIRSAMLLCYFPGMS